MALKNVYTWHDVGGQLKRRGQTPGGPVIPPSPNILLDETFDTWTLGVGNTDWTTGYWNGRMAGGQSSGVSGELARHKCITNPDLGGRCMELTLLANTQGGAGSTSMMVPLNQTVDDITLEVKLKLGGGDGTYDFGLGQKFPGPSGVRSGISASFPSGCKTVVDEGFSARCMQATHSGRPDAAGLTYLYGTDASEAGWACGEDGWWTDDGTPSTGASDNVIMTANAWHVLQTRVKLNTIDPIAGALSDGIVTTTWDGQTVYHRANRRMRVRSDVHATHFMWHWFYGGATADWAPTSDQHIWIDYIKVTAP